MQMKPLLVAALLLAIAAPQAVRADDPKEVVREIGAAAKESKKNFRRDLKESGKKTKKSFKKEGKKSKEGFKQVGKDFKKAFTGK